MMRSIGRCATLAVVPILAMLAGQAVAAPAPKIVGGELTTSPWPAQARLLIETSGGTALCGGTLVAPRWVLTAAHCVTAADGSILPASSFTATLGSTKLDGNGGTDHAVTQVVRDPSYNSSTKESDAALLRLLNPAHGTPMAIVSNDALEAAAPGSLARVLGWGTTSFEGSVSQDLRQVDVPIVDDATCGAPASYGSSFFPDVMLCAGYAAGGKDSCQGDSGGPLLVNTGPGTVTGDPPSAEGWKLAGIVSFGDGCAQPDKYGVYTELANTGIRSWIYQTIDNLPLGLRNPSFEQQLDGAHDWTATVYDSEGNVVRSGADACPAGLSYDEAQRRVCRVAADSFEIDDLGEPRNITVTPLDGNFMLRLGGPFHDSAEAQKRDRYVAAQSFVVDPANPVLHLNYNMLTFDYTNYDELRMRVRLFDTDGNTIYNKVVGSFGPGGDITFKSTGWSSADVNLSPYAGEPVTLRLDSGGTQDELYGFWAYIDAGTVPDVVSHPGSPEVPGETPASEGNPPQPVLYQVQEDANGLVYYNFAASSAGAFEAAGQCLMFKLPVPIDPGAGAASDVSLLLNEASGGSQVVPLEDPDADNVWTVPASSDGICAQTGTLYVSFTLTEGGNSQHFVVPLGGVTLIDPQGIVYDKEIFDADVASGMTPEEARVDAALGGAAVTLQRKVGALFQTVLSGDPGISPNVNPEITPDGGPSKGLYQWDVSAGEYRLIVTKSGYYDATSEAVNVPPPVTGLDIAMVPEKPTESPGPSPNPTSSPTPNPAPSPTATSGSASASAATGLAATVAKPPLPPCAGKRGRARKRCLIRQRRKAARARCRKRKRSKARARCLKRANAIGRKKKRNKRKKGQAN